MPLVCNAFIFNIKPKNINRTLLLYFWETIFFEFVAADRLQASCLNFKHKLDDHVHMKNVDGPHVAASWTLIIKHNIKCFI